MAFFMSCGPLEPSTYHEQLFRVATVNYNNGKAWLVLDCYEEPAMIKNLKDTADMIRLGLSKGDRILASISYDAVGTVDNATMNLDEFKKLDIMKLAEKLPADTLNYYYGFTQYNLANVIYPYIWPAGHFVNVSPGYFVPSVDSKADFYMYPTGVVRDTLCLCLYSDIPEATFRLTPTYTQSLLSCDVSSLRLPVADSIEQVHRDSLLGLLDNLETDTIMVKVSTPEIMRVKSDSASRNDITFAKDNPRIIAIPFDF